jgi:hypothetical protein
MKDLLIQEQVDALKQAVNVVNQLMKGLQDLNVDVRISYIEKSISKNIDQGITIWRLEEHNSYL